MHCEYLEQKGDPRRPYHYCRFRAATVHPGTGQCLPETCRVLNAQQRKAAPAVPAAPAAAAPAATQPSPHVGAVTRPRNSDEGTLPAMPASKAPKNIAWDDPASKTIEGAPHNLPLWEYCYRQMQAKPGQRGLKKSLTEACGCSASSLDYAIKSRLDKVGGGEKQAGGGQMSQTSEQPPAAAQPEKTAHNITTKSTSAVPEGRSSTEAGVSTPDSTPIGAVHAPLSDRALDRITAELNLPAPDPLQNMLANTRSASMHQAYDTVSVAEPEAVAEFIEAEGLQERLDYFLLGWRRRGLRRAKDLAAEVSR